MRKVTITEKSLRKLSILQSKKWRISKSEALRKRNRNVPNEKVHSCIPII